MFVFVESVFAYILGTSNSSNAGFPMYVSITTKCALSTSAHTVLGIANQSDLNSWFGKRSAQCDISH